MLSKFFNYQLLEATVSAMFVLVAFTAVTLTIYFFVLQRIAKKRLKNNKPYINPNKGRFFEKSDSTISSEENV